MPRHSALGSR